MGFEVGAEVGAQLIGPERTAGELGRAGIDVGSRRDPRRPVEGGVDRGGRQVVVGSGGRCGGDIVAGVGPVVGQHAHLFVLPIVVRPYSCTIAPRPIAQGHRGAGNRGPMTVDRGSKGAVGRVAHSIE